MKNEVSVVSTFGNFTYKATALGLSESIAAALIVAGLTQTLQRSPASAAEKEIAGYEKRPEKFSRRDDPKMAFSKESADILAKHLSKVKVEVGRNEKDEPVYEELELIVEVSENTGSGGPAYATERKAIAQVAVDDPAKGTAAERVAKLAAKVGYEGDTEGVGADNAPDEFLAAIRAFMRNALND